MSVSPSSAAPTSEAPVISGRWIVLAVFAFGFVATGGIWVYWKLHVGPFLPLQKALAEEFRDSSPRVEGGWTKGEFQKTPPRLRIVLQVIYPPDEQDVRVPATIDRVISLARTHLDIEQYAELEIYLVYRPPQKQPQQYEYKKKISDLPPESKS